jgi:hypothetical protein
MKKISTKLATKNKLYFKSKLELNLSESQLKNIEISDRILYDEYGRGT